MREIKFKAQRLDGQGWVVGDLFNETKIVVTTTSNKGYLTEIGSDSFKYEYIEVNPDTVCQFTGLLDDETNDLFEGDIINGNYVIEFYDGCFLACCMSEEDNVLLSDYIDENQIKLTSNIHDK